MEDPVTRLLATHPAFTPDRRWLRKFQTRLRKWFAAHRRDLPWRATRDPYHVWVSEIMLQQTQVATVRDYFTRFIAAFPTVIKLADADEEQVLRLWEGLGYYRRARQLHAAAGVIRDQHAGRFPTTLDAIQALPGIGRYTAGAIVSIAYDEKAPILEANTLRLYARLLGYDQPLTTAASQRLLWQFAEAILPEKHPGDFNQTLMELGSLICTPKSPDCPACPVMDQCAAYAAGRQAEIPAPKRKLEFTAKRESALVVWKGKKVLVRQCGPNERWAGLWDFPRTDTPLTPPAEADTLALAEWLTQQTGLTAEVVAQLTTIKHGVTRYRITLECFTLRHQSGRLATAGKEPWKWLAVDQLGELPLSTTGRKIAKLIQSGTSEVR